MDELDLLRKKIRNRMNEIADDLAMGAAADFHQYKHLTGQIAALAFVEMELIDIQKRRPETEEAE